jgi:FMN phosphatase YigB (HAD superfamily)
MVRQTTTGTLSYDEFLSRVAKLAGITPEKVRDHIEGNEPNTELFALIETELKPKYKIGLLSNVARNRLSELFTPVQLALFDALGLSYEMEVSKPDPLAYTTIAERLGVGASECIFVDDQPKYCEGAVRTGMKAVQYTSLEQLIRELKYLKL